MGCKPFPFPRFDVVPRQVCIDFFSIGVIVGERGVYLGERDVCILPRDLVRRCAHHVPTGDAHDGQSGSGDLWPPAANPRVPVDERADFDDRWHDTSVAPPA